MFLKNLKIENGAVLIRNIHFQKGINLIIDETVAGNKKESGNNVGKTTIIRLIDFCLGSDGENLYKDTEFKKKSNSKIESFLKENNIVITLTLIEDIENESSSRVVIRRNFGKYSDKIQEIDGEKYSDADFSKTLKKLIFKSGLDKPRFRQIIAKNIRDEKNRLVHTVKVLNPFTRPEEYEALYLSWLGIDLEDNVKKQQLVREKITEENLQTRLKKESSLSQVEQSLLVINKAIKEIEYKKNNFNLNKDYETEIEKLNQTKTEINKLSTKLSRLELRKGLILESKSDLEAEVSNIDAKQIEYLYKEASVLVPNLQKSFEETLLFHNQMVEEKIKYITKELPALEGQIRDVKEKINVLLSEETLLMTELEKKGVLEDFQKISFELNQAYEQKGSFERLKEIWENSVKKLEDTKLALEEITKSISSKDSLIQERVAKFNSYFSDISYRLYGERFVLSADITDRGYELNISSTSGNPGTGKKKGQMAAFDLAYIQFADNVGIPCLHFILQDQIENVHDNQITSLLTEIVSRINCQYILPVLSDKLPAEINVKQYEILRLSQSNRLFKLD